MQPHAPSTAPDTAPLNTPADPAPSAGQVAERLDQLLHLHRPRYQRLWAYCRNPMRALASDGDDRDRPYRQAQEWGLPARITGSRSSAADVFAAQALDVVARKEVVIENDIGWRIETMVDYLFGRPFVLESAAPDPARRALISALLREIFAHNGGILLLQQLALLGTVYGFVDVLVKLDPRAVAAAAAGDANSVPIADRAAPCGTPRDLGQPPAGCDRADAHESSPDGAGPSAGDAGAGNSGDASPLAGPAPRSTGPHPTGPRDLDDASHADRAASGNASHPTPPHPTTATTTAQVVAIDVARLARMIRLEVVEPARVLHFLSPTDWREVVAHGQCYEIPTPPPRRSAAAASTNGHKTPWFHRLARFATPLTRPASTAGDDKTLVVDLITPSRWLRYENDKLVAHGTNALGRIPLVHIQNTAVPMEYAGNSEVEPLIPLQDELNTRLSDRANRITLQSFKMYLGKGIENFTSMPVAPGRMWMSDNDAADVVEFGGDASCPSEDAHISDVREAMDKTSGVTPIAAGAIKGRIGRLTSAAALRVTLQALLAKTEKKRTTYGAAIAQVCELSLAWLDRAGVFATTPDERRVELNWPSPLPENALEKLAEAEAKSRLGVPQDIVLRELGY